jgi:hypothetical protein
MFPLGGSRPPDVIVGIPHDERIDEVQVKFCEQSSAAGFWKAVDGDSKGYRSTKRGMRLTASTQRRPPPS